MAKEGQLIGQESGYKWSRRRGEVRKREENREKRRIRDSWR
jgi:hypothetical protein